MFRVLLADDNKMSLEYFAELVDWESYGFELVYKAIDGENAWKYFQEHLPEVVITDIEMPVISGIELTKRIHESAPDTVVIFISSYKEFEYAHAALNLNVFSYMLKYETEKEDLVKELEKASKHLLQKLYDKKILSEVELQNILQGVVVNELGAKYPIELSGIYNLCLIEQNHVCEMIEKSLAYKTEKVFDFDFKRSCYRLSDDIAAVVNIAPYRFLAYIEKQHEPMQFGFELKDALEKELKMKFSLVIHPVPLSAIECVSVYKNIYPQMDQLFFYPASTVIDSSYMNVYTGTLNDDVTSTLELRLRNEPDNAVMLLDHWYRVAVQRRDYASFCNAAGIFVSYLMQFHLGIIDANTGHIFNLKNENDDIFLYDAFSLYQWLRQKYIEVERIISSHRKTCYSDIVKKAISYISNNYMNKNLSLEYIASELGVSVSGLNTVFKNEMGETVWKVIVKTRMEQAKKLLDMNRESISDICDKVGYNSVSYFSKAFKKMYGISPQEYRKDKSL